MATPISIRLDEEVKKTLEAEARARHVGLSTYLRRPPATGADFNEAEASFPCRCQASRAAPRPSKPENLQRSAIVFGRSICVLAGKNDKDCLYHNGEVEPNAPIVNVP